MPCEVEAGSVIFFNGYLLHRSLRNRSSRFRRALVLHYCSAETMLPWDWDGRVSPRPHDFRDFVLVAGRDPYAHKPKEEITYPLLRGESLDKPDPTKKRF